MTHPPHPPHPCAIEGQPHDHDHLPPDYLTRNQPEVRQPTIAEQAIIDATNKYEALLAKFSKGDLGDEHDGD